MKLNIPGKEEIEIKNVLLDFNGTIATGGCLIKEVAEEINELSGVLNFHVITADTYGTVERQLSETACKVITIPPERQDMSKLAYLDQLGSEITISVGNGKNDCLMLKNAVLGVAILQEEGLCTEALLASDIVFKSIIDLFAALKNRNSFIATLRN